MTPETIRDASTLYVDDINWTITPPLPSNIGHAGQSKQQKLSGTPVRCTTAQQLSFDVPEQLNATIGYKQDEQTDLLCTLCDSLLTCHWRTVILFPDVAKHLDASGKFYDWGKALKNNQRQVAPK